MTPTSTLTILGRSLRALFQRWPVLLTIQAVGLLLVLPIVLAFRATLVEALGSSPVVERMFSGFDHATYDDFMASQKTAISLLLKTAGPFVFVSIIINSIFGAGVAVSMAGEGTVTEFLKATGRFLGRSLRLIVYSLALAVLVLLVWTLVVGGVWSVMTSGDMVESGYLFAVVVTALLILLPVAILSLATEYARIMIVRDDRTSVLKTLFEGFAFVFKHPLRMVAQHGTIAIVMLLLVLVYWLLENAIGMTSAAGVLAMLLIQQASIFGRVAVRGWHTASGVALVDVLTPEVPVAAVAVPLPTSLPLQPTPPLPLEPVVSTSTPVRVRRAPRSGVRKPAPGRRSTARKGPKKR